VSPLLGSGLLSGSSPLQDSLCSLELGSPSGAEVLPAAIDEVLNHLDPGPEAGWRHILARHRPGDLSR
jgi:hypothetical protein